MRKLCWGVVSLGVGCWLGVVRFRVARNAPYGLLFAKLVRKLCWGLAVRFRVARNGTLRLGNGELADRDPEFMVGCGVLE
ncbi:MAG: hypothetical protein RLZZ511_2489, partial [Cyanobacteriota bacterium]